MWGTSNFKNSDALSEMVEVAGIWGSGQREFGAQLRRMRSVQPGTRYLPSLRLGFLYLPGWD